MRNTTERDDSLYIIGELTIQDKKFGRWTIRSLANPHVEILHLAAFEKYAIIAIVQVRNFVDNADIILVVQFALFLAVRQQAADVIQQMAIPVRHSS